jgi:hypothetical protein
VKNLPTSKEEAKKQFDYWTNKLNLKHTFTFDEVWDGLLEKRLSQRKQSFRNEVVNFEEYLKSVPGATGADPFPLEHTFSGGLYIRKLTVPPKTLTVTKIHKQEHAFFLMKGTISILTEEGVKTFTAPYQGITKPGTKRIIYHHDDVIFTTVHACDKHTVEEAEEQVIAKDFNEIEDKNEAIKIKNFIDIIPEIELIPKEE